MRAVSLEQSFHKRKVVKGVSLEVKTGEVVGLLGPNGAGKTTIFYMMVGLISSKKGEIYLNDLRITHLPMYRRARLGISYLPQEPSVFRKLNVEENLLAILETLDLSDEEREDRLHSLLRELNISHLAKNKAYSLSGGRASPGGDYAGLGYLAAVSSFG